MSKHEDHDQGESAEAAYKRGHNDGRAEAEAEFQRGYVAGIEHASDEFRSRMALAPATLTGAQQVPVGTPDEELEKFIAWQKTKGDYWQWENECLQNLLDALVAGDKIEPSYAFSCWIVRPDGTRKEFLRRPDKKPPAAPLSEKAP